MPEPRQPLLGRTVVVTGAGSGIGSFIARHMSGLGAAVALLGRRTGPLQDLADELAGRATAIPCDITRVSDIERAVAAVLAEHGAIDVLVNNAGFVGGGPFLEDGLEALGESLAVDVIGSLAMTQAVARHMVTRRRGVILFHGSINAHGGNAGYVAYNAAKAAVLAAVRTLAVELGPFGVRVNSVSPGWVDVPEKWSGTADPVLTHLRSDFARVPLRRMVAPGDVAAAFGFLATDDAAMITGHDLVVDGGLTASLHVHETLPKEATP